MHIYTKSGESRQKEIMTYTAPYQSAKISSYAYITGGFEEGITIEFDKEITNLMIRPQRLGIRYETDGKRTVTIYPKDNCNISVEPDGTAESSVLLFIGKSDELNRDDYKNIIRFTGGRHFGGDITVTENDTLIYIDENAVVDGRICADGIDNIGIDGCGELTYEAFDLRTQMIALNDCTNIKIKNIVLKDSTNWNIRVHRCTDVHIDNVKIIGRRGNSDGIDVCNSRNVYVSSCFTRTWDDSLVVKGLTDGDVRNVHFENCVLWNDFARPIEIGVETRADEICDVSFEHIDIIHSATRYPALGIHHGDRAKIHGILFNDIVIEDSSAAQLADLRTINSAWNSDSTIGTISDVTFRGINIIAPTEEKLLPYRTRISGHSDESAISRILFDNITLSGKTLTSLNELGVQIFGSVSEVALTYDGGEELKPITSSMEIAQIRPCGALHEIDIQVTLTNPHDIEKSGECSINSSPSQAAAVNENIRYNLAPHEIKKYIRTAAVPGGRYAFALASKQLDIIGSCALADIDLVTDGDFSHCPEYRFCDSYGNSHDETVRFAMVSDGILAVKTDLLRKYDITAYIAPSYVEKSGDMLFSVEDSNSGSAPALTLGDNGEVCEAPQIGCPEEIAFVFKNYPHIDITPIKLHRRRGDTAYIPLDKIKIDKHDFRLELSLHADYHKRYEFTLFGTPIPRETIREPRVMAHMFAHIKTK